MTATALRLKMSAHSVKFVADHERKKVQEEITLRVVYGEAGTTNAQWSKWTPFGELSMTISNPEAFDKVRPGQFFFVDLIPTDKNGI